MAYDLLGGYDPNKTEMSQLTPEERELLEERHAEYWRIVSGDRSWRSRLTQYLFKA